MKTTRLGSGAVRWSVLLLTACDMNFMGPSSCVRSVTVSPPAATVAVGEAARLSATVLDSAGKVLGGYVTWTSDAPGIASVDHTGLVLGVATSTANAVIQTSLATLRAVLSVGTAALTLNPLAVLDAAALGAERVAGVAEQTTIGTPALAFGGPQPAFIARDSVWLARDRSGSAGVGMATARYCTGPKFL